MKAKTIPFTKMAGAGNDFLVLEHKAGLNYKRLAVKMCDRTNGVGADGLLVLAKSRRCDFNMRIINADGSQAEMCGNGVRCLAAYIVARRKARKKLFSIETLAGEILAEAKGEITRARLSDPAGYRTNVSVNLNGRTLRVHTIDTGVPHAIVYVDGLPNIDVNAIGRPLRRHKAFAPRGANINFVEQIHDGLIAARTYERGVEGETKACGTGSVAAALVSYRLAHPQEVQKKGARMKVRTASGEVLSVTFDILGGHMTNVWLKGSAHFIAEGKFFI